ncbi:MAG: beta-N-acetylhexosaminidase, partial [Chitinophagaceae bacterium]
MKRILPICLNILTLFISSVSFLHAQDHVELNIIPRPNFSLTTEGHTIMFDKGFIVVQNPVAMNAAKYLKKYMKDQFELDYTITNTIPENRLTQIVFAPSKSYEPEAYEIEGSRNVVMINGSEKSSFWAVQSLLQLFEQFGAGRGLPQFIVRDQPRFAHRGLMLDAGRYFIPVDEIKKTLELMSFYKLNTFHWHLTEDQGWRIEIKKYPNLTRIGSNRKETILEKNFDPYIGNGKPHGGYYTQEQVKDIVAYATSLNIEIIPEIEMPGHAQAALASYPYLGCTGGPYSVATKWGVSKEVFCAGKDSTFTFLENVLKEIIPLFPSKYIHIGGDECPKDRWKECVRCQQRMKDEHLKNEHEL